MRGDEGRRTSWFGGPPVGRQPFILFRWFWPATSHFRKYTDYEIKETHTSEAHKGICNI